MATKAYKLKTDEDTSDWEFATLDSKDISEETQTPKGQN